MPPKAAPAKQQAAPHAKQQAAPAKTQSAAPAPHKQAEPTKQREPEKEHGEEGEEGEEDDADGPVDSGPPTDGSTSVRVGVRCRPFNKREKELGAKLAVRMEGGNTFIKPAEGPEKRYDFDYSIWSHDEKSSNFTDQEGLYHQIGKDAFDDFWKGYDVCLFAYGQSGSGKSFSMVGITDRGMEAQRGLVPRVCDDVLSRCRAETSAKHKFKVTISMLEIYLGNIVRDLLTDSEQPAKGLDIFRLKRPGTNIDYTFVKGLTEHLVNSTDEMLALLKKGQSKQVIGATGLNATSSRAHTIFEINLTKETHDPEMAKNNEVLRTVNTIRLIDLAGSERLDKTRESAAFNKQRQAEGVAINQSLTHLGMVIKKVAKYSNYKDAKQKEEAMNTISWRSNKLSMLLRDSLGGNCKTIMIAAISPNQSEFDETNSTLRYASACKKIKNPAVKAVNVTEQLKADLDKAKNEIKALQDQLEAAKRAQPQQQPQVQVRVVEDTAKLNELTAELEKQRAADTAKLNELNAQLEKQRATDSSKVSELTTQLEKQRAADAARLHELNAQIEKQRAEASKINEHAAQLEKQRANENSKVSELTAQLERQRLDFERARATQDETATKAAALLLAKQEEERKLKAAVPYLVHLHVDPKLSGLNTSVLPPGDIIAGEDNNCKIHLGGMRVLGQHAVIKSAAGATANDSFTVTVEPLDDDAIVIVNGKVLGFSPPATHEVHTLTEALSGSLTSLDGKQGKTAPLGQGYRIKVLDGPAPPTALSAFVPAVTVKGAIESSLKTSHLWVPRSALRPLPSLVVTAADAKLFPSTDDLKTDNNAFPVSKGTMLYTTTAINVGRAEGVLHVLTIDGEAERKHGVPFLKVKSKNARLIATHTLKRDLPDIKLKTGDYVTVLQRDSDTWRITTGDHSVMADVTPNTLAPLALESAKQNTAVASGGKEPESTVPEGTWLYVIGHDGDNAIVKSLWEGGFSGKTPKGHLTANHIQSDVASAATLSHLDRVVMGQANYFLFFDPKVIRESKLSDEQERALLQKFDWEFVQNEVFAASLNSVQAKAQARLQTQLAEQLKEKDSEIQKQKDKFDEEKKKQAESMARMQKEHEEKKKQMEEQLKKTSGDMKEELEKRQAEVKAEMEKARVEYEKQLKAKSDALAVEIAAQKKAREDLLKLQEQKEKERAVNAKSLDNQMAAIYPLLNEARAIVKALKLRVRYDLDLEDQPDGTNAVFVNVFNDETGEKKTWSKEKFTDRLTRMREIYTYFLNFHVVKMTESENPFVDSPYLPKEIGVARVPLSLLYSFQEAKDTYNIVHSTTNKLRGGLKARLSMNYQQLAADIASQGRNPTDVKNLSESKLRFVDVFINIEKAVGLPANRCSGAHVAFKIPPTVEHRVITKEKAALDVKLNGYDPSTDWDNDGEEYFTPHVDVVAHPPADADVSLNPTIRFESVIRIRLNEASCRWLATSSLELVVLGSRPPVASLGRLKIEEAGNAVGLSQFSTQIAQMASELRERDQKLLELQKQLESQHVGKRSLDNDSKALQTKVTELEQMLQTTREQASKAVSEGGQQLVAKVREYEQKLQKLQADHEAKVKEQKQKEADREKREEEEKKSRAFLEAKNKEFEAQLNKPRQDTSAPLPGQTQSKTCVIL